MPSGNITIGAKSYPNWASSVDALTIGYAGVLYEDSYTSGNDNYLILGNNTFYNAIGGGNTYIRNDEAQRIMMQGGSWWFQQATAGTAGNTIAFSNAFRITSDGRAAIGNDADSSSVLRVYDDNCVLTIESPGNNVSAYAQLQFKTGGSIPAAWIWRNPPSQTNYGGAGQVVYYQSAGGGGHTFYAAGQQAQLIDTSGRVKKPLQPAFMVTGGFGLTGWNSMQYAAFTSSPSYNIGNHYSSGIFTAPVSGRYLFYAHFLSDAGSGYVLWNFQKNTSSAMSGYHQIYDPGTINNGDSTTGTQVIELSTNDTVRVAFSSSHNHVYTASYNYFGGYLLG